jgi:hypothetical protein
MKSILSGPDYVENRRKLHRRSPKIGKVTQCALLLAITTSLWIGFKRIEPIIFPVVIGFEITSAQSEAGKRLRISGTFDKVRQCKFIEVLGYSDNKFVSIAFAALPGAQVPSRLLGVQTYGPWLLAPEVSNLKLYSRHQCATGEVVTNIFDGTIVTLKTDNTGV